MECRIASAVDSASLICIRTSVLFAMNLSSATVKASSFLNVRNVSFNERENPNETMYLRKFARRNLRSPLAKAESISRSQVERSYGGGGIHPKNREE